MIILNGQMFLDVLGDPILNFSHGIFANDTTMDAALRMLQTLTHIVSTDDEEM